MHQFHEEIAVLVEASSRWPKSHLEMIKSALTGFKLTHGKATPDIIQKHAKEIVVGEMLNLARLRRDQWMKGAQGHLDHVLKTDPGPDASGYQRTTYDKRLLDAKKNVAKVESDIKRYEKVAKRVKREGVPQAVLDEFTGDLEARPGYWNR